MPFILGRDITYTFYPLCETEALEVQEEPVTIYVYSGAPTRAQARAGTGSPIHTITEWEDTIDGNGKQFVIPAIPDPDPEGTVSEYTYYLGINYYFEIDGQMQTEIQALPLQRAAMHHRVISVTAADLKKINSRIAANFSDTEISNAISAALELNQSELSNLGFEWAKLWRPDKLSNAIKYKALYILLRGNQAESEDTWKDMSESYRIIFQNIFSGIRLEYKTTATEPGDLVKESRAASTIRIVR